MSDVLQNLHRSYPLLNLQQYMPLLQQHDILYAKTVLDLQKEYFLELGIPEGAVGILITGVQKVIGQERRERKRARYQRQESVDA